jgi:hypothetical protein
MEEQGNQNSGGWNKVGWVVGCGERMGKEMLKWVVLRGLKRKKCGEDILDRKSRRGREANAIFFNFWGNTKHTMDTKKKA